MRHLKIHVLDVGHGDTIILEIPIGKKDKIFGVIDCIKFEEKTKPYLESLGVKELAFVCVTHPHDDHVGGIQQLLETYNGKVGELWVSGKEHQTMDNLLRYLDCDEETETYYLKKYEDIVPVTVETIKSGTILKYGKVKLHILSPPSKLLTDSKTEAYNINNASIVIKIEYGESKILLAGDAQFGNWAHTRINHAEKIRAQVLKASHHGSKHGNFLEVLEIISPNYVIVSAGSRKPTDFPHQFTKDAIKHIFEDKNLKFDERFFVTRDRGNIIVRCTGSNKPKIEPEK